MRWSCTSAAFLLAGAALLGPRLAQACSCIPPKPPAESLADAASVFEGEIASVEPSADGHGLKAQVVVIKSWKGISTPQVEIATAASSAACGLPFTKGERWLLYAFEDQGKLHANLCSRSARSSEAATDFAALGAPSYTPEAAEPAPAPPPPEPAPEAGPPPAAPPPGSSGCAGCTTAPSPGTPAGLAALALAFGVTCSSRRRRRWCGR